MIPHRGFTLIEMMIALAILAGVMVMATEALTASRDIGAHFSTEDELTIDSARISKAIAADLAASGWHVPAVPDPTSGIPVVGQLPSAKVSTAASRLIATVVSAPVETYAERLLAAQNDANRTERQDEDLWADDRQARYWPNVYVPRAGLGELGPFDVSRQGLPYLYRGANAVIEPKNLPYGLPGTDQTAVISPPFGPRTRNTLGQALSRGGKAFFNQRLDGIPVGLANRAAYLNSFYMRSQELCFLKQAQGNWTEIPDSRKNAAYVAFPGTPGEWTVNTPATRARLQVKHPSAWKSDLTNPAVKLYESRSEWDSNGNNSVDLALGEKPYGVEMFACMVNSATGSSVFTFATQWETIAPPTYELPTSGRPASFDNQNALVRDYAYCVVPSRIGLGRLVRAFRISTAKLDGRIQGVEPGNFLQPLNPASTSVMVVDEVLSDHVVRVVFDTARTDNALSFNQVRARIYLARTSVARQDTFLTRVIDQVYTLRARNAAADRVKDQNAYFGTSPAYCRPQIRF